MTAAVGCGGFRDDQEERGMSATMFTVTTPARPMPPGVVDICPRDEWLAVPAAEGLFEIKSIPRFWKAPSPGDTVRVVKTADGLVFGGGWIDGNLHIDVVERRSVLVELRYYDSAGISSLFEADPAHVRQLIAGITEKRGWSQPAEAGFGAAFRVAVPITTPAAEIEAAFDALVGLRAVEVLARPAAE
jgi:hypothetical protein